MYTLKIEYPSYDLMKTVQAFIQENKAWMHEFQSNVYNQCSTITVGTRDVKELKRLVDIMTSEDFMRNPSVSY